MRRLVSLLVASLFSLSGLSCVGAAGPPLAMHVDWGLDGPAGTIPPSVTLLTVLIYTGAANDPQTASDTVSGLMDVDMNGQPDVVRRDLPLGVPIRMTILGQNAGGANAYVGHAGPFTLVAGERRYLNIRMYAVGQYTTLTPSATELPARLLATTTTLSDGRVLVSGGFTRATTTTSMCPVGATCFDLTAAADAYIFDVASGTFTPVRGGLHQARGGHTATLLPGDRVLIAGGAAHALLVLSAGPTAGTLVPTVQSLDALPSVAGTSFEIFLPDANAEMIDVGRNGDVGRGGFVGAADNAAMLGRLDTPRFMHAAAVAPGHPSQVLLVGGIESPNTWVVYDDQRAGGYGVLAPDPMSMNHLRAARTTPSVVPLHGAMGDALWIIGGSAATTNGDIAEVWTSTAAAPNGTTAAATGTFTAAAMVTHPEFSLARATAIPLDASHALIVGWYGPSCDTTATPPAPSFAGTALCDADPPSTMALTSRSFTLDGMTGVATRTVTRNHHALTAGVRMSDGSALVAGGIGSLTLVANNTTDHFGAMVTLGAATNDAVQPLMMQARMLHAMAALDDGGALVLGGITISGATPTATVLASPEVLYLPR